MILELPMDLNDAQAWNFRPCVSYIKKVHQGWHFATEELILLIIMKLLYTVDRKYRNLKKR